MNHSLDHQTVELQPRVDSRLIFDHVPSEGTAALGREDDELVTFREVGLGVGKEAAEGGEVEGGGEVLDCERNASGKRESKGAFCFLAKTETTGLTDDPMNDGSRRRPAKRPLTGGDDEGREKG